MALAVQHERDVLPQLNRQGTQHSLPKRGGDYGGGANGGADGGGAGGDGGNGGTGGGNHVKVRDGHLRVDGFALEPLVVVKTQDVASVRLGQVVVLQEARQILDGQPERGGQRVPAVRARVEVTNDACEHEDRHEDDERREVGLADVVARDVAIAHLRAVG